MAPVLSGDFVAFGATPKRHLHSPQSTLEFRSVTAVEDRREMGALHSPIREDCGLGRDDCDAWSEDSTCTLPFTPERGAPPSYEHVMTSPMPVGPPRSPPRRGHQNSYSGEGGAEYDSLGFPVPDWLSPSRASTRWSLYIVLHVGPDPIPTPSPPRYEEIRVTFPAARTRQLSALEAYKAAPPESRAPGGEARLALALEGVHPASRGEVWGDALDADGKRDGCSTSYDEYLDAGPYDEEMRNTRERIRTDCDLAFPNHPRFVRALRPLRTNITSVSHSVGSCPRGSRCDDFESDCGSLADSAGSHDSRNSRETASSSDKISEYCLLDAMERVLCAHAVRSPHGHADVASTITGILLLVTENEELTFWMLTCFAEDLAPWAFSATRIGFLAELLSFDKAISIKTPLLSEILTKAYIRPSLVCAGFFAKLGAGSIPGEALERVWDAFILEGPDTLPHVALGFLKAEGGEIFGDCLQGTDNNDGSDTTNGLHRGAALLDQCEERFAGRFEVDEIVASAIWNARDARVDAAWLSIKANARQEIATKVASLASFRVLRRALWVRSVTGCDESLAQKNDCPYAYCSRETFHGMVANAYVAESESAAAAVVAAFAKASSDSESGATFGDWLESCASSDDQSLVAAVRLTNHHGEDVGGTPGPGYVDSATRAFLNGEHEKGVEKTPFSSPGGKSSSSLNCAPSPSRLNSAVRTARAATMSFPVGVSDASASALESAMLFGRGGERWLESVRSTSRGAVVLASVVAAVTATTGCPHVARHSDTNARTPEVSLASTHDVVPSMGSLFNWPPMTPHTRYALIVQVAGEPSRRVTKRFSDFRALHAAAEREGVVMAVGHSLALPTAGVNEWSSDPDVVTIRRVQLQRYLDVLASSGCAAAAGLLCAFLSRDEGNASTHQFCDENASTTQFCPKTLVRRSSLEKNRRKVRGACALRAMTCGPNAFTGEASLLVW